MNAACAGGRHLSLFQTIRLLGLATLLLSIAACGPSKKHRVLTQKEIWQNQGFEAGLKKSGD
jgi:hypothetical protein